MGYEAPPAAVSASWQTHKDRNPPSSEPGTDYGTPYGTPVAAPWAGVVIEVKASNSYATGRYVAIAFDDGRSNRALHMAEVWAATGQRVARGDHIGLSGASGYGSDWYYGPHVHETLWPGGYWEDPTIDFDRYVGEEEEDDMTPEQAQQLAEIHQALWNRSDGGGWPGGLEQLEHLRADTAEFKYTFDGLEVPAGTNYNPKPFWRRLGQFLAAWKGKASD